MLSTGLLRSGWLALVVGLAVSVGWQGPAFGESEARGPRGGSLAQRARAVVQVIAHRGSSTDRPECTLAALRRAIVVGATASEVDVRWTRDRQLVILHDETLDRTTNGTGKVGAATLAEVRRLDAGSWFDAKYRTEKVPTLREVLEVGRGRIDVLLDLKEQGEAYDRQVAEAVKKYGSSKKTIVGVRSVAQARRFRRLLPKSRQLGLIPDPESIEAFVEAGVETIRLWPRWVKAEPKLVARVHRLKVGLHINGSNGAPNEVEAALAHRPTSLSSDDPGRLVKTLRALTGKGK
jgi:glycerophosphoryl diester phosphodiesterase